MKVFNFATDQFETFRLVESDRESSGVSSESYNKDIDQINLLCTPKIDLACQIKHIMNYEWCAKNFPDHTKLRKEYNTLFQTPGDTVGVQQSIKSRLETRLKVLINKGKIMLAPQNNKVRIKLSGDGTNIGKHLHVINVAFTILGEGAQAMSADGNHLVAVIKVREDYDNLFVALSDIRNEVEQLTHISVDKVCFYIEWFLGGDWKFLVCICGLGAAHATFPCIWCKCPLYDHYDGTKTWSLRDIKQGARTIQEIQELTTANCGKARFNVKHAPLFPTIPLGP